MDLSLTYLHLGSAESPPIRSTLSSGSWISFKELPLFGQLSLPQFDHHSTAYPFLPLIHFNDHHGCPHSEDICMASDVDDVDGCDDDVEFDDADGPASRSVVELPLFWSQNHPQQCPLQPMDSNIWSSLPRDLLERIIAFLHVPDAVRLFVVSKQWNSIASSPNFIRAFASAHRARSFALMFQCNASKHKLQSPWLSLYDITGNRWYSMTLNFMPAHPTVPFVNYTVISSSGGLLCLWPEPRKTWKSVGLIVCNPVTRKWRELPSRSQDNRMPDLVAMYTNDHNGFYKVLVITETASGFQTVMNTEVYDSREARWTLTSSEPSPRGKFKSNVIVGGKLYLVYAETDQFEIKVFDMEEQQWESPLYTPSSLGKTAGDFGAPELLGCNNHLFLVERVGKHPKEEVVIWELDSAVSGFDSWREVDRMPQDISREFLGCLVFGHYCCIGRGDQIFFIASFKAPMVIYDVLKRTWSWWAWPFYEKYASRFPIFGFVKQLVTFPPFGFAFDFHFDRFV